MAQDYNAARSNKPSRSSDGDDDGDGIDDGTEEAEAVLAYLGDESIVAERFTVCLPDAEVPGGNGSIREAVTPERLIAYLTGESDGGGRVYSWGTPKAGPDDPDPSNDCNDDDPDTYPGAVCGTTPHFVADVSGPMATGGGLEVIRGDDEMVFLRSSSESSQSRIEILMTLTADPLVAGPDGDASDTSCSADDDPCSPGVWARTTESGSSTGVSVYQVMVQPPRCPHPFPALLYVQRCESDGQLVYTGGWAIDDAALYEDSVTVLSMAGATEVVGIECCFDYDSDRERGDVVKRSVSGERGRRGARLDSGTSDELIERGVMSKEGHDLLLRKRPGRASGDDDESGEKYRFGTHVPVDAPVLHLVNAGGASESVKFKAGAELSKSVN
ncbi:hypothetical protein [Haloferax sp. YSSS75]|uniref:hypothetical protein n=1 Tax=Haloferax sp. YSSS75 TaxID=3388564 RepID=UPI00398D55CE